MTTLTASLQSELEPLIILFSENPVLRIGQVALILVGFVLVYLVFYTTRDIILRTHSFVYMLFCILLVALIPVLGFLIYLLIRPPRTFKQREMDNMLKTLMEVLAKKTVKDKASKKKVVTTD